MSLAKNATGFLQNKLGKKNTPCLNGQGVFWSGVGNYALANQNLDVVGAAAEARVKRPDYLFSPVQRCAY